MRTSFGALYKFTCVPENNAIVDIKATDLYKEILQIKLYLSIFEENPAAITI